MTGKSQLTKRPPKKNDWFCLLPCWLVLISHFRYNGTDPPPGNFIPWGTDSFPQYIDFWGATLPRECTSRQPYGEHWRCIVADYSFEHVATPVFVAEALTDKTVIPLHTGVPAQDPKQFTQEEAAFVHVRHAFPTLSDTLPTYAHPPFSFGKRG